MFAGTTTVLVVWICTTSMVLILLLTASIEVSVTVGKE